MRTRLRTKIVGEHRPGCFGVTEHAAGRYPTPFSPVPDDYTYRMDARGRKLGKGRTGHAAWVVFPCMMPACPCKLMVHSGDLWQLLAEEGVAP